MRSVLAHVLDWPRAREEQVAEQVRRRMLPRLPPRVANAPALEPHLQIYYTAYCELMTDRPAAIDGSLPIPWSSCARYARFHGFDYDMFNDLVYFVREMDEEYAKVVASRAPSEKGKIGAR